MAPLSKFKTPSMIHQIQFGFHIFYSSTPTMTKNSWDPTVSLSLKHHTLILLEKHCKTPHHFKQILSQMMRLHLITQTFPMSRLLHFSALSHPENLNHAITLFTHFTPSPNLYIFNTMISALSFSPHQSTDLYKSMLSSSIYPDEHTLLSLLKSPDNLSSVGPQVHGHSVVMGLHLHLYLQNSLIKMYVENGHMGHAHRLFRQMPKRDVVSYNIMISSFARRGLIAEVFRLFYDMGFYGVEPDRYTMVDLLVCCGRMKNLLVGRSVHAWIMRRVSLGGWGLVLNNALLDMYAKCAAMEYALMVFDGLEERDVISWNVIVAGFSSIGELDTACKYFFEMPVRDSVSWNSLLAGYARKGDVGKVADLFKDMVAQNVRPDKVTAVALVSAAAEMGILNQGRCIHGWVVKEHGSLDAFVGSALIDMYCKCGSIERSLVLFRTITRKDVALWTTLITGLAFHGHGIKALELFHKMQEDGLMPNSVTLIAVLTACSHAGLLNQGLQIFNNMEHLYGIEPGVEHYGCLVDLFARSGRLNEAKDVIRRMPMKPSRSIWGSILSASRTHRDVELAETALRELQVLEPDEEGGYVLLSNVYASCGIWSHCDKIREVMGSRGVKKTAGRSSLVVDGVVHEFISSDKKHSRQGEIYGMLGGLHREMRSCAEKP